MRTGILVLGALLLLVGLVWAVQGASLIGGSFMSGDPTWIAIGMVAAVAGACLIWWATTNYRRFP